MRSPFLLFVFLCPLTCFAQNAQLGAAPQAPAGQLALASSLARAAAPSTPCWYDTSNRNSIAGAYNGSFAPNALTPMGWTGSYVSPNAGTTSIAYQNAVLGQINWVRALAGVPCIGGLDATESAGDQSAAFMMMTNGQLSHAPPSTWLNWTAAGASAAGNSNLCFGYNGDAGCVRQYMADTGTGNEAVGHRRWMLYPQTTAMGTGDVPSNGSLYQTANALWVIDSATIGNPRPATRDGFVAWPPPGYSPYQLLPGRWSFSYPGADFSTSYVTMVRNGVSVPVTLLPVANGFGENTIVWVPGVDIPSPPAVDTATTVTIGNVKIGGVAQSFNYQPIIFDPATSLTTAPTADAVSPNSGAAISQTFSATYSSVSGYSALNDVYVMWNAAFGSAGACMVVYDKPSNGLFLYNDAGTGATGPMAPGAGATLSNSQCTLFGVGSSVSGLGNTLTLKLNLVFSGGFQGAKTIFLYAADSAGLNSGWQTRGTWTVPSVSGPPTADSATPNTGSGTSQTFAFRYSSASGYAYLGDVYALINGTFNTASACWVFYDRSAAGLFLVNDAGNALLGPIAPGANATLQNGQCTLNGVGSSVSGAGSTLTMTLNLAFKGAFAGAKTLYLYAADSAGLNSGWQNRGAWTVPSNNTPPTADSVTPNAGSGASHSFTLNYSSVNGWGYLTDVYAMINGTFNGYQSCWVYYDKAAAGFFLVNDAATGLLGPLAPGSNGSIQNSQCTLSGIGSSVSGAGNTLSMALNLSFSNTFLGTQTIFMYAADGGGLNSGWLNKGTWTVPAH